MHVRFLLTTGPICVMISTSMDTVFALAERASERDGIGKVRLNQ